MRSVIKLAAVIALACPMASVPVPVAATAAQSAEDTRFEALAQRCIAELTQGSPVYATQLGEHRYDDRLSDVTASGRAKRQAQWGTMLAELSRIDRGQTVVGPADQDLVPVVEPGSQHLRQCHDARGAGGRHSARRTPL